MSGDLLTPRQRRAVEALLEGCTQRDAAQRAGVGERTLRRWLAENGRFSEALKAAEAERLTLTLRKLAALAGAAVGVLQAGLRGEVTALQLRAADVVLGRLLQLREMHEFEQRLRALEERFEREQATTIDSTRTRPT